VREETMRTKPFGAALWAALLLAACAATPGGGEPATESAVGESSGAAGPGTWAGFVTYRFNEDVSTSGPGMTNRNIQTYEAKVEIRSTAADVQAWQLAGDAEIKATRSLRWESTLVCYELHDDQAVARAGSVDEHGKTTPRLPIQDGGLEVADDFYQFWVSLPDLPGVEVSKRVYGAGCGLNETDTHEWIAGAGGAFGGSGKLTDPNRISGSKTTEDGRQTTTWELTRAS